MYLSVVLKQRGSCNLCEITQSVDELLCYSLQVCKHMDSLPFALATHVKNTMEHSLCQLNKMVVGNH